MSLCHCPKWKIELEGHTFSETIAKRDEREKGVLGKMLTHQMPVLCSYVTPELRLTASGSVSVLTLCRGLPGCGLNRGKGSARAPSPWVFLWGALHPPFLTHTKTFFSRPRTSSHSGGGTRLPRRKKTHMVPKPAWSQPGQETWGPHWAFLGWGFSLNPQSSSSADPHLENQLTVE